MTIIIVGGLHGDERSAWMAAKNLSQWPGAHTILIDNPALYTRTREIQGNNGQPGEDLNRLFGISAQGLPVQIQGQKIAREVLRRIDAIALSPKADLPCVLIDLHSAGKVNYNHPQARMLLSSPIRRAIMAKIAVKIPICMDIEPEKNMLRWYYEQRGGTRVISITLEAGGGGVVHRSCVDALVGAVRALRGDMETPYSVYTTLAYEEMTREAVVYPHTDLVRNAVHGAEVSNWQAATVEMKDGGREERMVTGRLLGSYLFEDGDPEVLEKEDWICQIAR